MFPLPAHLAELASRSTIQLANTPFPLLLVAHHAAESTGLLIARRGPVEKRVVLDHGVPVDCRSNLAHETFSRFLAASGRLSAEEANSALARSLARGVLLGEILLAEQQMDAAELQRHLQQCLARKLFDLFTWRDGEVGFEAGTFATAAALKVKVARLVLAGVERFVPRETIDSAISPLAGSLFALHPDAAARCEDLRPSARERRLLDALARPRRIEELLPSSGLPLEELSRLIWGMALIGLVIPADGLTTLVRRPASPPGSALAAVPAAEGSPRTGKTPASSTGEPARIREQVAGAFAKLGEQDAFDLLGASEEATIGEIRSLFFDFARQFAPWELEAPELQSAAPAAQELFAAGALAFATLCDAKQREALRSARRSRPQAVAAPAAPGAPRPAPAGARRPSPPHLRLDTDLLDVVLQYKKGRQLKEAKRWGQAVKQFDFAADCDPQNGTYRAEAAHCRFLLAPATYGAQALEELKEAQRIDPEAITPYLYAGEIAAHLGRLDEAETYLRSAARRLGPEDRRAIAALRELGMKRRK